MIAKIAKSEPITHGIMKANSASIIFTTTLLFLQVVINNPLSNLYFNRNLYNNPLKSSKIVFKIKPLTYSTL